MRIERASTRVFVNTGVQYVRSILSAGILLYTSRLILAELGVDDFGLYSLIAGVIALLSFIKDSLASTIQRFLSFYQGKNDLSKQCDILSNSLVITLLISIGLVLLLFLCRKFVLTEFLNIDKSRVEAAYWVYNSMLFMLFFTMQSTSYFAVLIAHENIVYTSIIQMTDVILKLFISISLAYVGFDKLVYYACLIALVPLFDFVCYYIYCKKNYTECKRASVFKFKPYLFKELFVFTGWMVYSIGCIVGRTQGIAVLLNRFFGTALNASYGIAQQVIGQISFLSTSLINAMQPQIVKAEGAKDRNKMFQLSEMASKFSFLLFAWITIPSLFYMDRILQVWLGEIPDYAVSFCRYSLFGAWMDQFTMGLGVANRAIGKIKIYSIVTSTIKILTLPFAYLCLKMGMSAVSVMVCYVFFEIVCSLSRIVLLKIESGLSIMSFINNVFVYELIPVTVLLLIAYICSLLIPDQFFWVTYFIVGLFFILSIYCCGLTRTEKEMTVSFMHRLKVKLLQIF